jgi:hypothetical protein
MFALFTGLLILAASTVGHVVCGWLLHDGHYTGGAIAYVLQPVVSHQIARALPEKAE